MSAVVHRRVLMESTHALVKARDPSFEQLKSTCSALAQVAADMSGQECELVLRFKLGATQTTEGAGNGRDVE